MQLQTLRPKQGADLLQLGRLMEGRGWKAALPDSFPDAVLLRLARDFRFVESSFCNDSDEHEELPSLAPAIYVVMNLMAQHPARGGASGQFELSETGMMRALQMYQWGIEREIISRIVGVNTGDHTQNLLEGLWRCMHD